MRQNSMKIDVNAIKDRLAGRFEEKDVYMLTSSPRSGSTLLAQVLNVIPDSCVLFEPLQLNHVPEARAAGFSWRMFVAPDEEWPEGEAFLKQVFEGRVINAWTAREMAGNDANKAKRMIVKCVRANRLLPWICRRFEIPAPILLIRHPCAVIASQKNYNRVWKNADRPDYPEYLDQYPVFQALLSEAEGDEEFLAALWALDQLPPLLHQMPRPWLIVTYEELFLRPEMTLARIFDNWGFDIDMGEALSRMKKPSSVVGKSGISGVNGWKQRLTGEQVSRILQTVNAFGLTFYTENDEADYDVLYGESLSGDIHKAGIG